MCNVVTHLRLRDKEVERERESVARRAQLKNQSFHKLLYYTILAYTDIHKSNFVHRHRVHNGTVWFQSQEEWQLVA